MTDRHYIVKGGGLKRDEGILYEEYITPVISYQSGDRCKHEDPCLVSFCFIPTDGVYLMAVPDQRLKDAFSHMATSLT